MPANCGFATVGVVRTRRLPVAAGSIAASVLLLAATACSSSSDDSTGASLPSVETAVETAVETTVEATAVDATEPTGDASQRTDAPSGTTEATIPDGTDSDDPSTTEVAVVVPEALRFTAPLVGGGTFDGAAVAGKPTVFWFWAPT